MNLKELFLTIATLKHEPRLLREAFSPDVVSGKKRVKLPKYCWRDAVLKVVWPDGLPNALQNHYCPLFWVSNVFPLLWAWAFVKFCLKCLKNAFEIVGEKVENINSKRAVNARRKKEENKKFEFFRKVESLTPALIWEHLFADWDYDYDGSKFFYKTPEKYTVENISLGFDVDDTWEKLEDWYVLSRHLVYRLKQLYGAEWKHEAVRMANEHLVVHKQELIKKQEKEAARKQFKNVITLNFKEALKDSTVEAKVKSTFQKMQESRQVAQITEISHTIFKYGFIGMGFILAALVAVFTFKFLGTIVAALEWCLDLVVTVAAFFYLEIYTILGILGLTASILLFIYCFVRVMEFFFKTERGEAVLFATGNFLQTVTVPIWWPIMKGAGLMVDLFELTCNIVKMTYNENCPAVEREGDEKKN